MPDEGRASRVLALALTVLLGALTAQAWPPPGRHVAPEPLHTLPAGQRALPVPPTTVLCRALFQASCYQPAQLLRAYDVTPLHRAGLDGRGRTIVIVVAFGSPTIAQDLDRFDRTFGLPAPPSLRVIAPAGEPPPFDPADEDM